jgi:hypothetical protein
MIRKSAHSARTRRVSVHIAVVVKSAVSVKVPGNGKQLSLISPKEISMRPHIQRNVRTAKEKVSVIIVKAREAAGHVQGMVKLNLRGDF